MTWMLRKRHVLLLAAVLSVLYVVLSLYDSNEVYNSQEQRNFVTKFYFGNSSIMARKVPPKNITAVPMKAALTTAPKQTTSPTVPKQPLSADTAEKEALERIRSYTNGLPNTREVSVVTAYFNLGNLSKRSDEGRYTPNLYKKWMSSFGHLDNPLVVFADTEDTANYFRQIRAHYPAARTTVIVIRRNELRAFQLAGEIQKVYSQPGYPRHPPNTINPLYSCAMHAKYELVQRVIRERLYQTPYVAWLDIGLFRAEAGKNQTIHLTVPEYFNRTSVGYSLVNKFENMKPKEVIWRNMVWVGGASFLATPEVAYVYCNEYWRAVRKLLDMNIMSTDQQVIYSIFQPSFDFKPRFSLQLFTKGGENGWFGVGYAMKNAP